MAKKKEVKEDVEQKEEVEQVVEKEVTVKRKSPVVGIIISFVLLIAFSVTVALVILNNPSSKESKSDNKSSAYEMTGAGVEDFDLYFLKQDKNKNVVYSPLSIKYALSMLNEGAEGNTKTQITNVIGKYTPKKYTNSKNMSFANALFVKDSFRDQVSEKYVNSLKDNYNAEVIYDSFESPKKVNDWVSEKTLKLINNLIDNIDSKEKYILINALGIDMEWKSSFVLANCENCSVFGGYNHEQYKWAGGDQVEKGTFKGVSEDIATMDVIASLNNYDIIKEVGEDNIRKTVRAEYIKYLKENNYNNLTTSQMEKEADRYIDAYIKEIKSNYKTNDKSTEFSLYVDDDIKVFAKDLKEYNNVNLQYVAIMPTKEDLDEYVSSLDAKELNETLGKLKELKNENFKEGVITSIKGSIPKFKFDYNLNLLDELKSLGITDAFDSNKADLSGISEEKTYIGSVLHKANIEFTQEGIKASAATEVGGYGAGGEFSYNYEVPVEEIDLTFDNPYMFLIRDKETGEVWFLGTVYEPSLYKNEPKPTYW